MTSLKPVLKRTMPYHWLHQYRLQSDYRRWLQAGRPMPPPHLMKQRTIKEYARRFGIDTFIETGTYQGDMVDAVKDSFKWIYSIEISPILFEAARQRFHHVPHISILPGDSGEVLPALLLTIDRPCLFWLDGHYSAGMSAKGVLGTPIRQELDAILQHAVTTHVVLVDDARCFIGQNDYPGLDELRSGVVAKRPAWAFEVHDDVIRIYPRLS